jgi:hypothetical protein
MTCTDPARHVRLLDCRHLQGVTTLLALADGCSGRLCAGCEQRAGTRRWPDVADRITGPAKGLDLLEMVRAMQQ